MLRKFNNLKKGNRLKSKVYISKTKKLGWTPKYDLKKYLEKKIQCKMQ